MKKDEQLSRDAIFGMIFTFENWNYLVVGPKECHNLLTGRDIIQANTQPQIVFRDTI